MSMHKNTIIFLTLYFPEGSGGYTFRNKLVRVLSSINSVDKIICLHADSIFQFENRNLPDIEFVKLGEHNFEKGIFKLFSFLSVQLKSIAYLAKWRNKYNTVMVMCGNNFVIPVILAKILGKKTVYLLSGVAGISAIESYRFAFKTNSNFIQMAVPLFYAIIDELSLNICDFIILESPNLIHTLKLCKYKDKTIDRGYLYVELSKLYVKTKFEERKNTIGYIGRFSQEKGIINFIDSIPLIMSKRGDVKIFIAGWGDLFSQIETKLINYKYNQVIFRENIPHDKISDCLNGLKLVILPSYTEGLPNIMLEAMACGTPVLATPVGGVPDVIKDGETGFIMENNSPECIAENVIRALEHPDLERIVENARAMVEREFTYEAAVERYRKILDDL